MVTHLLNLKVHPASTYYEFNTNPNFVGPGTWKLGGNPSAMDQTNHNWMDGKINATTDLERFIDQANAHVTFGYINVSEAQFFLYGKPCC